MNKITRFFNSPLLNKHQDVVRKDNCKMMQTFMIVMTVCEAAMLISGFADDYYRSLRYVYIGFIVVQTCAYCIVRFYVEKHLEYSKSMVILGLALMYGFCFFSGIFYNINEPSISIYAFQIIACSAFLMPFGYTVMLHLSVTIVYSIVAIALKPVYGISDATTAALFLIMALRLAWRLYQSRVQFLNTVDTIVEKEKQEITKKDKLLNDIPVGIGIFEIRNGETRRIYMNDWFYHMTENPLSVKESYDGSKGFFQLLYDDDKERVFKSMQEVKDGADYSVATCRVWTADKKLKWVRLFSAVTERDEEHILVYTSYVDMSYEMDARMVLQQNNELLHRALKSAKMVVWEYDPTTKVLTQTRNCSEQTGYKNLVIHNAPDSMIDAGYVKEEYISAYRAFFHKFCTEKEKVEEVFQVKNWQTSEFWYEQAALTPVFDEAGNLIKGIGTSMDITERVRADEEKDKLRQTENALEVAKSANVAKSEFLSRISHDIRTPMNAIIGFAELGKQDLQSPELISQDLERISSSAEFLLGLVNDVLDMSKIESNAMELKLQPLTMHEFEEQLNTLVKPMCNKKKLHFAINMSENMPKCLMADNLRVKQIFFNLLSNAVKFTPEGGTIEVTGEKISEKNHLAKMRFCVRDNGIGMSKEFQEKMFDSFSQEQQHISNEQGTGLGLSIVKSLLELMNGSVHVDSTLGKGTEFVIELQLAVCEIPKEKKVTKLSASFERLQGKNILLCEDHPLNTILVTRILEQAGIHVVSAANGREGVATFENAECGFFDAILMDIRMPEMDGLEAARRIRSLTRTDAKEIPVIAMTANAYDTDVQSSFEAGMNAHLTKPINPQELLEKLNEYISN